MRSTSRLVGFGLTTLLLAGAAACSSDDAGDAGDISCAEVMSQASYEAMRQLAAAGVAADPSALHAALPADRGSIDGSTVELPEYRVLIEQFDDSERATLLSALASRMTGVGDVFDVEAFSSATSATGDCAGWLSDG